ncbi:hypothetical protein HYDPIDRAFT_114823 [Hydnomerulius pinastri MD-312]|uniref:DUF6533 domain-containing protein n=1 Tax=Hydnomerulius pinastri MD-312 TaxID=994086 RepID=A0A0C9WCN9_9AGAM|nr:hypothetical protein HYDPIDRAFT_114823 [Hydnomerulius pinastri MD-312]
MADSSSPYVQAVFSETLLKLANGKAMKAEPFRPHLTRFPSAIGPTILVYDYPLTFGREVELVWKSPRNTIKVVFLISRYLPFFDATVQLLYRNVLADPSPETCKYLIPTQVWLSIFGSNVSEFLFLLRTWAVWEKDRAVGIFLAVTTVTCLALGIYGSLEFLRSLTFVSGSNIGGCLVLSSSNMLLMDYSAFMVIEAVQLILMLIKSYANYRRERKISKLTRVVIRDGIMYYLVLFGQGTPHQS